MSTQKPNIALCSVVTRACLEEFELMKYSVEYFHGCSFPWFIRCDDDAAADLSRVPNARCTTFEHDLADRPDPWSDEFRNVARQKMMVIGDAWAAGTWDAVVFLDADIIATSPFLNYVLDTPGEVVLSPHHRPPHKVQNDDVYGRYNAGFVLTRTDRFHTWWREAFESGTGFVEQGCLTDSARAFSVGSLGPLANIGIWRAERLLRFPEIPKTCWFLHAHFFQPPDSAYNIVQRAFAIHCLEFLYESRDPGHRAVLERVLAGPHRIWYRSALEELLGRRIADSELYAGATQQSRAD